jgi:hypothetical protein
MLLFFCMKWRGVVLNFVGLVFIFFGSMGIVNAIYFGRYVQILWFCYIGLILMGVGVLKRSSYLVGSQLNILLIPLIFWSVDFIYLLFGKGSFLGIADYMFWEGHILPKIISLQHLFSVPLALYSIYLIGLKRKDMWKFSFAEVSIIYFASYLFSIGGRNINCTFVPCINVAVPGFYPFVWFFVMFIIILVTNFLVVYLFTRKRLLNKIN